MKGYPTKYLTTLTYIIHYYGINNVLDGGNKIEIINILQMAIDHVRYWFTNTWKSHQPQLNTVIHRFRKCNTGHDDVIKWKHFPRYWPFVRGIHRSPVNSQHKGQWRGALTFYFICSWIKGWVSNREAGDWGRRRAHYYVIVLVKC